MRTLPRTLVDKVWGVDDLPPQFGPTGGERIGEVWFTPPPEVPDLLVKYIFTSERLSVQAHPDDEQARAMGLGDNGKSECWVILDAEPGATIAVGFRRAISAERMRQAALDGSIVDELVWHEVAPGDAFYIPAGTVHAIGGGVSLIEVQQNSDITFRLFDYGRPRELHLDQGVAVADTGPYPDRWRSRMDGAGGRLVDGPHFELDYVTIGSQDPASRSLTGPGLAIPFSGAVELDGSPVALGECVVVDDLATLAMGGSGTVLLARSRKS